MDFLHDARVQLIATLLAATLLAVFLIRRVLRRICRALNRQGNSGDRHLAAELVARAIGPLTFFTWYYAAYVMARVVVIGGWVPRDWDWIDPTLRHLATFGLFVGFLWYFFSASVAIDVRLRRAAGRTKSKLDDVLLPLCGTALRAIVPILAIFTLLRLWPISDAALAVVRKLLAIALIAAITWTMRRAVLLIDAAVLGSDDPAVAAIAGRRALYTRVTMLRRVSLVLIALFALAAVLMMFQEVRVVGRSILASAGIAGIVLGIAAQRSLGNLLAGIQIAVTQPIRLGDQVLVEGDVGNIEEITLTYVVVRVWDQRRIVLPISYFIEKPFQNWTRVTTNMLSPLTLRVDFQLPVDALRRYLQVEIARSEFWDRKVFGVQVTNADDRSMEVRVLASAPDSGASFNLQCELREKAIDFIRQHYPACLPKLRVDERQVEAEPERPAQDDGNRPLVPPSADTAPSRHP